MVYERLEYVNDVDKVRPPAVSEEAQNWIGLSEACPKWAGKIFGLEEKPKKQSNYYDVISYYLGGGALSDME